MPSDAKPPQNRHGRGVSEREIALWFAARGYPVHPLIPGRKIPPPNCAKCRGGKHRPDLCPCLKLGRWCHGFHAATVNPKIIQKWWMAEPNFGIGISCGPADLVVIDVDRHNEEVPNRKRLLPGIQIDKRVNLTGLCSGFDTLALLSAHRSCLNPVEDCNTLRIATPSGGMHIWYKVPENGPQFRSSNGSSNTVALAWQVDVRAYNGYIVGPMTRTPKGMYLPLEGPRLPADLPAWLASELTRTGHVPSKKIELPNRLIRSCIRKDAHSSPTYLLQKLLSEVYLCQSQKSGMAFSEKLNRAAFTAGGLVAAGILPSAECFRLLMDAAMVARPNQPGRNRSIINSGYQAGNIRPIYPKERS